MPQNNGIGDFGSEEFVNDMAKYLLPFIRENDKESISSNAKTGDVRLEGVDTAFLSRVASTFLSCVGVTWQPWFEISLPAPSSKTDSRAS